MKRFSEQTMHRVMMSAFALVLSPAVAMAQTGEAQPPSTPTLDEDIESIALPMNRLVFSERNGDVRIISDNGRYVFRGTVFDTWDQTPIEGIEDAEESANRMNLEGADLDIKELKPITYGEAPAEIVAFIQPGVKPTDDFLAALKQSGKSAELIVYDSKTIPEAALIASACPVDEAATANAFVSGNDLGALQYTDGCDPVVMQIRNITRYLLGYEDLPLVIRGDHRVHSGFMENWQDFLGNQEPTP